MFRAGPHTFRLDLVPTRFDLDIEELNAWASGMETVNSAYKYLELSTGIAILPDSLFGPNHLHGVLGLFDHQEWTKEQRMEYIETLSKSASDASVANAAIMLGQALSARRKCTGLTDKEGQNMAFELAEKYAHFSQQLASRNPALSILLGERGADGTGSFFTEIAALLNTTSGLLFGYGPGAPYCRMSP